MTSIDSKATYILILVYDPEIPLKSKFLLGKELLAEFKEEALIEALDTGSTTLFYKGNEYFLDEKIPEEE